MKDAIIRHKVITFLFHHGNTLQLCHLLENKMAFHTWDKLAGLVGNLVCHNVRHLVAGLRGNRTTARRGRKFFCCYNWWMQVINSMMNMIWHWMGRKSMWVIRNWVKGISE